MSLTAEIKGVKYVGFKSYSVSRSVEDLSGDFSLTISTEGFSGLPFVKSDNITIYVGKTPVLTGYIEKITVSYDDGDHTITISGRDKVADLIDSTIGHKIELKAPVTLEHVIKTVMKEIGMTGVPIHNKVSGLAPFNAGEIVAGEIDTTIFDFLEKYTRKRQVLMTTDGKGGFVLLRAGQVQAPVQLLHYVENEKNRNNIKKASADYDDSECFYQYRVHSQGNPSATATLGNTNNTDISNRMGVAYDTRIRKTRVLDLTAESSSDTAILVQRAKWEANIRRARSMTYNCTVQDHVMTKDGKPWEPNLLTSVIDEYVLIESPMLIKSVKYSLTTDDGSTTEMELVSPDAYLPEPEPTKKSGKIGRKKGGKGKGKKYTGPPLTIYPDSFNQDPKGR